MKPELVKFVIYARDMDRAVDFYRDAIGFEESFRSEHWSELRHGDAILGLHGGGDGSRRETGLSIQYAELSEAWHRALSKGGAAVLEPQQRDGEPIRLAILADPEGNEIMMTQWIG